MKETIIEMESYAEKENIPIIEKKSIQFINKYIELNQVKNILEIGSAIGYSSILMASVNEDIHITTIEKDEKRYMECIKNVKKVGYQEKIDVVFQDALEVNFSGYKFDLIFIDAAKGQYIKYFEKFKYYLNNGGAIITDNLHFHGLVNSDKEQMSKNVRGIVTKIENYISFLNDNKEFVTKFYDIGDGLSVSFRRVKNEK